MQFDDNRIQHYDTFTNYIKLFNLTIIQALREPKHTKQCGQKAKSYLKEFDKFMGDYNRKQIRQMKNIRVHLPPVVFKNHIKKVYDEDFMCFENQNYVLKYIFIRKQSQFIVNVQIYKSTGGVKQHTLAYQKLQTLFLNELYDSLNSEQKYQLQFLQKKAVSFLADIVKMLGGQKCQICKNYLSFNLKLQILLPPTIRLHDDKKIDPHSKYKYYHEACL